MSARKGSPQSAGGAMERRGQMLRKEMALETLNEWLLETQADAALKCLLVRD